MSEYQYYEFLAVDRPLTVDQMDELRRYSTRARITPNSFVNVYNWGSFKGDPDRWIEEYFDAFLYLANWGTRHFMFRVPMGLLDPDVASEYLTDETLSCRTRGKERILSFFSEEEESEWTDGEGWLASLIQLRADLMHRDLRCLYLGWLLGVQNYEFDDDMTEPPVPPGLRTLNAPLVSLTDFLRIDRDLITAAAEESDAVPGFGISTEEIAAWVRRLPAGEKDAVLTELIAGEAPHIAAELKQQCLRDIRNAREKKGDDRGHDRRSVGRIRARAEEIARKRREGEARRAAREKARREREEAERRKKHLESLVGREAGLWTEVERLVMTRQPKRYDEAVALLRDLCELAEMKEEIDDFSRRVHALCTRHSRKETFVKRVRNAQIL